MLNPAINNINENKSRLNKKTLERDSVSIFNELNNELELGQFNEEKYKVKEQLKYQINNFDTNSVVNIEKKYSLKDAAIINENKYAINSNNARVLTEEISLIQNTDDKNNSSSDSLHDFFNEVKNSIVVGKHDGLDVLKELFSNYMDYVNEVRTIISSLSQHVKAGSKDGYINFDESYLFNNLSKLISHMPSVTLISDIGLVFESDGKGGYNRNVNDGSKGVNVYYENYDAVNQSLQAVEKTLSEIKGLIFNKKDKSKDPKINIYFSLSVDVSDIQKLRHALPDNTDGHDILQTEFDLIKKSIDAFEKKINTNLEEISKKYSAANSNFDNFVKIVSSTMNTLLEMAKGFLRF
ncbi:SipD family cell invasion protein [Proteus hauseri ATCC 700826]|uniref:SipD family cell invasion protein n=1 Tax=Proteus hauseri ATCC 700826 TaxID=1354271 RepID=A0AAJ3LSG2_PROHU|nr:IpaD/SipD/SspD family type III secretion system needle tip protein [Proteus hauseri]OAT44954.1 SipD family cell invasion protein [Proteus hauseri ATCC 700826]